MHEKFRISFGISRSDNLKSKMRGLSVIAFVLVVNGAVAQTQQSGKVPRSW
jgi:hypothetical protein